MEKYSAFLKVRAGEITFILIFRNKTYCTFLRFLSRFKKNTFIEVKYQKYQMDEQHIYTSFLRSKAHKSSQISICSQSEPS